MLQDPRAYKLCLTDFSAPTVGNDGHRPWDIDNPALEEAYAPSLGYTIVANIGNNDSDLAGGHAERTFKLPDDGGQLS